VHDLIWLCDAEYCNCCDLVLNADEVPRVAIIQAWLWCVGATLVWAVWLVYLQGMQAECAKELNKKNVSAGDYSVWVSNLAGSDGDDNALREFARHYGSVITAFHIRDFGNLLRTAHRVSKSTLYACICADLERDCCIRQIYRRANLVL
jgi:hypothetical protein